jgi:hypothetical protein
MKQIAFELFMYGMIHDLLKLHTNSIISFDSTIHFHRFSTKLDLAAIYTGQDP